MTERDDSFDEELMEMAAKLPTEVAPDRDLWPDIELAINEPARPQRNAWNSVWAQAAAVLLLVGGSSLVTWFVMQDENVPPTVISSSDLFLEPVSTDFGGVYSLGNDYIDARGEVADQLDSKLASLDPDTRTAVENNLQTIRDAIADINNQLAAEPDNALLQELLLSTYQEEMSLLVKVDSIANAAMRRDDI